MGNKDASGTVVDADGMEEEFELARQLGLHVIPIGASGFVARKLWDRAMADIATFLFLTPAERSRDCWSGSANRRRDRKICSTLSSNLSTC